MDIDDCFQQMDYEDVQLNVWFSTQFNIKYGRERELIWTQCDFRVIVEFDQTSHKNKVDITLIQRQNGIRVGYNT